MNILECGGALTRQRTPQQRAQLVTNDRSILRGIQEGIQAQSNAGVASNDRRFHASRPRLAAKASKMQIVQTRF
jgi:hypothetical protein